MKKELRIIAKKKGLNLNLELKQDLVLKAIFTFA
tara:strand:- start:471 stop:572 length:102 start_codon:yes stop_codon:yes gene_type:complete